MQIEKSYYIESVNKISAISEYSGRIHIKEQIRYILDVNSGDTIFFLLYKGNVYLTNKYISGTRLIEKSILLLIRGKDDKETLSLTIPKTVLNTLDLTIGDRLLMVLDENGNIILRDPFLIGRCAEEVIKKGDIGAKIIGLTTISHNFETTIPKEIKDIFRLNNYEELSIFIDNYHNIVIYSGRPIEGLMVGTFKIIQGRFYIPKMIINNIDADKGEYILWLIDENENIIIKNSILPSICFKQTLESKVEFKVSEYESYSFIKVIGDYPLIITHNDNRSKSSQPYREYLHQVEIPKNCIPIFKEFINSKKSSVRTHPVIKEGVIPYYIEECKFRNVSYYFKLEVIESSEWTGAITIYWINKIVDHIEIDVVAVPELIKFINENF